jgi:hypothetical protein
LPKRVHSLIIYVIREIHSFKLSEIKASCPNCNGMAGLALSSFARLTISPHWRRPVSQAPVRKARLSERPCSNVRGDARERSPCSLIDKSGSSRNY